MRFIFLFLFVVLSFHAISQKDYFKINVGSFELMGGDDVFFDKTTMYIPNRSYITKRFTIKKYSLKTNKKTGTYKPPKEYNKAAAYSIDSDYIFFHTNSQVTKVSMITNKVIWKCNYNSGMAAQIAPIIFKKYIGITLDDLVLLIDKETGDTIVNIKGLGFTQLLSVSGNILIYGYDDELVKVYDIKNKKDLYEVKIGDQPGQDFLMDGNHLIFPSTNLRLTCVEAESGENVWTWNSKELAGGCGWGFNYAPTLVNNQLFVTQRTSGLYVFDKTNGKVLKNIDFGEYISTERILYKDQIVIIGEQHLFLFNPKTYEYKKIAKFPLNENVMLYIDYSEPFLCLHNIGNGLKSNAKLFNLEELINKK